MAESTREARCLLCNFTVGGIFQSRQINIAKDTYIKKFSYIKSKIQKFKFFTVIPATIGLH